MIPWWVPLLLLLGGNLTVGGALGCCRLGGALLVRLRRRHPAMRARAGGASLSVADVPALLPALDAFVLPSRYEGLPVALAEAVVAGIPAAATDVGAVSDVMVDGETRLLVPARRPERLAAAITCLLDEPACAARMARAGRERLGSGHTPEALGRALAAAYTGASSLPWSRHRDPAALDTDVPPGLTGR